MSNTLPLNQAQIPYEEVTIIGLTQKPTNAHITPTLTPEHTHTQIFAKPTITPNYRIGSTQISPIDGMNMVYVPAENFIMGSEDSDANDNEKPEQIIGLDSFWIDEHEITIAMYKLGVSSGVCTEPEKKSSRSRENYYNHASYQDFPVNNVDLKQQPAVNGLVGNYLLRHYGKKQPEERIVGNSLGKAN